MADGDDLILPLSGSTDGRGILVTGTASGTAVTIHTADSSGIDLVTLDVANNHSGDVDVTIMWGGTTNPNDYIVETVRAARGSEVAVSRKLIQNSLVIKAFASVASEVSIGGDVLRMLNT